ncbi:hypothetical protein HLK59_18220 [Streptomyces sp. S3(2020)]|uniref:hypothetical protein n=1 Tax=Streptomyces sp. S3(2020) TaxID=2732044 RepID=UPI001488B9DC|nr:hypothetical protein [Streptomyces sp. S3(2020)]NNN32261.1 hypothetical protein [Streptomyces sp. S3(2020)]
MIDSSDAVFEVPVPPGLGAVTDLAPVGDRDRPAWLALDEDGTISRWDVAAGRHEAVGTTGVEAEDDREPWDGRPCRRRLHASHDGGFAAVVNDHGRFGEVIDLRTGEVTVELDGGGYNEETVPFSLAFARRHGRCVVVHRTDWNRLDVTDPQTGASLTDRSLPEPEHDLDYFHGALYVSPDGRRILDDGWVWHPAGIPVVWDFDPWVEGNVWESEDGPSRLDVCDRGYAWNHAMTWIDSVRVAVVGLRDVEGVMPSGARIFDTRRTVRSGPRRPEAVELLAFEGPTGPFFSDGTHLFSCGDTDLSIWDPAVGKLLGTVPGFSPTHYHPGARQFVQLADGVARHWTA